MTATLPTWARVTNVSAFPDIGTMSAYPDFFRLMMF